MTCEVPCAVTRPCATKTQGILMHSYTVTASLALAITVGAQAFAPVLAPSIREEVGDASKLAAAQTPPAEAPPTATPPKPASLLQRADLPPLSASGAASNDASPTLGATADAALGENCNAALALLGPEARARGEKLLQALAKIPERYRDPSTPPLLRAALAHPDRAADMIDRAVPSAEAFRAAPYRAMAELAARLAGEPKLELPPAQGRFQIQHTDACVWFIDFLLNPSRLRHTTEVSAEQAKHPMLRALVERRLDNLRVDGAGAEAERAAMLGLPALTPSEAAQMIAHFDVVPEIAPDLAASERAELPEELKNAVEGEILNASLVPELGWIIVGGPGPNRYDLTRIAGVFDVAGDDHYRWGVESGSHRLVIDLAGNDVHTAPADALGPAAAVGGVAVIDDFGGNDRYEGGALTAGAALGLALIVDRAGDDRYQGGAWSLGAAAGGAAILLDLAGNDAWSGEGMALGVGGPSGVGAVVDVAGDDSAQLGTRPSVYGVAGEHAGFGLGFGFGFRLSAAGGVGLFADLAGNDRRTSGEFSQGCGYFLGLGALLDRAGDDLAECDRYGLGGSAHQAAGVFVDRAGNDRYRGRTAAHIGGAWDETLAVFVDDAGDDTYHVDSLSIGAAANQALGIAIDRGGRDRYTAGGATLGAASSNNYHFATTNLASLAFFFDLAGLDEYPTPTRSNDATLATGEDLPAEGAGRDSVFVDRNSQVPAGGAADEKPEQPDAAVKGAGAAR